MTLTKIVSSWKKKVLHYTCKFKWINFKTDYTLSSDFASFLVDFERKKYLIGKHIKISMKI